MLYRKLDIADSVAELIFTFLMTFSSSMGKSQLTLHPHDEQRNCIHHITIVSEKLNTPEKIKE